MSDHREYISEVADRYTATAIEAVESEEGFLPYDVDLLTSPTDGDRYRVEFLLAGGGPTAVVTVDSRYESVKFFYSWGKDRAENDLATWELYGDAAEFWKGEAENVAECYR